MDGVSVGIKTTGFVSNLSVCVLGGGEEEKRQRLRKKVHTVVEVDRSCCPACFPVLQSGVFVPVQNPD